MTLVRTLKANEGPKHTDDLVFLFSPIIRTLDGPIEDALDLTLYLSNGAGEVLYNPWGAALKHFLQIDRFAFDYLWYPSYRVRTAISPKYRVTLAETQQTNCYIVMHVVLGFPLVVGLSISSRIHLL